MDAAVNSSARLPWRCAPLLVTALAPLIPQMLGSAFNIWYNLVVINPLLATPERQRLFINTVIFYNAVVYPAAMGLWIGLVFSLRDSFNRLEIGTTVLARDLERVRRRVIHLPWWGALISGGAWLLCIPVFLITLSIGAPGFNHLLFWHLPISFVVSAFIAITHSFFLVELSSHWGLFPVFFRGVRADLTPGAMALSLRGRGIVWAISAAICPIGSLLLLNFAPHSPETHPEWFALFVGSVGIAFGLCTSVMISRLVAEPIDHLRRAATSVREGKLDVEVPLLRADEFGELIGEFNHMIRELRDKEQLRRTFGLHVGRKAAEEILTRDPGLNGAEQTITVVFVDIRSFTARSEKRAPQQIVAVLNEFLHTMVHVVEEGHGGMINKFLGDGFMALFGVGTEQNHAREAVEAGVSMLRALEELNQRLAAAGELRLDIGIGIHTGPAIVGSIGSPERLEFTAIGSTVNVASRVESLTKHLGEPLLITHATKCYLADDHSYRELPPQSVKGVEEELRVWTPVLDQA